MSKIEQSIHYVEIRNQDGEIVQRKTYVDAMQEFCKAFNRLNEGTGNEAVLMKLDVSMAVEVVELENKSGQAVDTQG